MPNHAKKQEKNANHVMWNVLICTIFTFKKLPQRLVALFCSSIEIPPILGRSISAFLDLGVSLAALER